MIVHYRRRKNNKTRTGAKRTWCGRHVRVMNEADWTYASKHVTCEKCKIAVRVAAEENLNAYIKYHDSMLISPPEVS